MRKLILFLYSNQNIVGSALGLLGLALFFVGLIKSFWFFIVVGLYGIGYVIAPRNRAVQFHLKQDLTIDELQKALDRLVRKVTKKVSPPVLERISSIVESLNALLPQLSKLNETDHHLHVIKQTATDYLPNMLNTYLELPPAFARFHIIKGEKTPRDLLLDQLDILDNEMKSILTDLHTRDTEALMAHGVFLKNKFKAGSDWLK